MHISGPQPLTSGSVLSYRETFDQGPGGWWGWGGNDKGLERLKIKDGAAISHSPWWIDYNHAPPGAGYIHMIFCLNTRGPFTEIMKEVSGTNHFASGKFPLDFTNAKVTFRLKGELLDNSAKLVLLLQSTAGTMCSGWMLTGQPLHVTREWTDQTLTLSVDDSQWSCLGARHDRADYYGNDPLVSVLGNVNINLMLVMFPLEVDPMGEIVGDPHILRPERDYPVWRSKLPEGYVMMDSVQIDFAR